MPQACRAFGFTLWIVTSGSAFSGGAVRGDLLRSSMLPNQEMDSQMGKGLQRTGCVVDAFDVQVYAAERV
jgi:hypothetical protein